MSEELKPCPFCGGAKISYSTHQIGIAVGCDSCGAVCEIKGSKEQCAAAWNTRTQLASTGGEAVAWKRRDGVMGCKRFMTQKCYDAQSPQMKGNYEPFHCANCAAMQPAPAGLVVDRELLEFLADFAPGHPKFDELRALLNQAGGE